MYVSTRLLNNRILKYESQGYELNALRIFFYTNLNNSPYEYVPVIKNNTLYHYMYSPCQWASNGYTTGGFIEDCSNTINTR